MAGAEALLKRKLHRALFSARVGLFFERFAGVWTPFALAALLIFAAGAWGVFAVLPGTAHMAVVATVFVLALAASGRAAFSLRWPNLIEAASRLESDNRLSHGPIHALTDAAATGEPELWSLHQNQAAISLQQVKWRAPRWGLVRSDPFALRFLALFLLILALFARGPLTALDDAFSALYAPHLSDLLPQLPEPSQVHKQLESWVAHLPGR